MEVELPTSPEGLLVLRNRTTGECVELEPAQGGAVRQIRLRSSSAASSHHHHHHHHHHHPLCLLDCGPEMRFAGSQLVPWANRVREGSYVLPDGRRYAGLPINEPAPRHTSLHGLLHHRPMRIVSSAATDDCARVTLAYRFDGSDEGYPFQVEVQIVYRLVRSPDGNSSRMECETLAHNEGAESAPFGAGWHPYFKLPAKSIDSMRMTMEAGQSYITDERMIPVGSEAWPGMADESLNGKTFDTGFRLENGPATTSEDHLHRTLLHDPGTGTTLVLWQDQSFPCLQIYTPGSRESIAVEPMSHPANGFNSGDFTLLPSLNPQDDGSPSFRGKYGVYLQ
jgi:aldose 1-epimerase